MHLKHSYTFFLAYTTLALIYFSEMFVKIQTEGKFYIPYLNLKSHVRVGLHGTYLEVEVVCLEEIVKDLYLNIVYESFLYSATGKEQKPTIHCFLTTEVKLPCKYRCRRGFFNQNIIWNV
jgi:hypothetical protein